MRYQREILTTFQKPKLLRELKLLWVYALKITTWNVRVLGMKEKRRAVKRAIWGRDGVKWEFFESENAFGGLLAKLRCSLGNVYASNED
ncbi:hypothetical protein REPUB_Repub10bG0156200 [Reevesia pubescens]